MAGAIRRNPKRVAVKKLTITTAVTLNGKILKPDSEKITRWLAANVEQAVSIELRAVKGGPTHSQYAYLYGVIYPHVAAFLKEQTGYDYTPAEVDQLCKVRFWFVELPDENGEAVRLPDLKRKMNPEDMAAFIDNVLNYWTVAGVDFPAPSAEDEISFTY